MGASARARLVALSAAWAALAGGAAQPAAEFMVQRVDHFDPLSEARWSQPLFVNDTFWRRGSRAPVFLCLGGEGPPLDGSAVRASVHCNDAVELLRETGALMIALEHRYYSESRVAAHCVSRRGEVLAA
jgi:serine protease 16